MAIPSDPTIASIVTEALKRAGRTTPSSTQISDATTHQFREVKSDINTKTGLLPELLTQSITGMAFGGSVYSWPVPAQDIASLQLIEFPETGSYRDTCSGGTTTTITLSLGLNIDLRAIQGRYVFVVLGTGAGSFGQIVSWDNTTKVAVIDTTLGWRGAGVTPVSGDTYVLENSRWKIWDRDRQFFDSEIAPYTLSRPYGVTMIGRNVQLFPTPNSQSVLLWTYWSNLDYLDETGVVFTRHLRTYRSLWVQGIAVKCMQRYDEDRYQSELGVYLDMLTAYESLASNVGQTIFRDV